MNAELLLRRLGISGRLHGFHYTAYMIERVVADPTEVLLVTKILYPAAARHFRVSMNSVERNLRTVIHICWNRGNRAFMEEMAGATLHQKPTNSAFIDMAAAYLRRQAG